ncbi:MAG: CCA tRNA nucleotidyltransferase [Candidatus Micrarchaeota archaeon]|nr:CCA tRNA nucleotidyltransferase [Candidatus Micrarchaeota archaeon]MDE1804804.1 CCA tRNA nucleotidyltransferase [Candidatus Micrarchaeota archaeon]MDE1846883.1 CCA tRNA nucleotidyltransferase [Candidatus Micrarchaeota archaeon]
MDAKRAAALKKIYARVLKEIKPGKLEIEATTANANRIMGRLKKVVPRNVEIMIVGSISRSTNLKGDHDIDIFLLFDKKVPEKRMESLGVEYAKRIANRKGERIEIKYAEHPYVRLHLDEIGMKIDLVPAYKIRSIEERATAVDRTPLHTKFLNENLTDKQRDDVRLLKCLLKSHGIYGAEVRTQGFSGYLCELLIFTFGSLNGLLEEAAKFRVPLYIHPREKGAKAGDAFKKFNSEFIVIDPVDKTRNVAAGVSKESLARLVMVARLLIDHPGIGSFYGKGFSALSAKRDFTGIIKRANLNSYIIAAKVPDKSDDIIWPQLRKASEIILDSAKKSGFRIYLSAVWVEKGHGFMLFLSPKEVLTTRLFTGPSPLRNSSASIAFIKAHNKAIGAVMTGDIVNVIDFNRYETLEALLMEAVAGKITGKRKDISLKGAKLFANNVPKEYSETVYAELISMLSI